MLEYNSFLEFPPLWRVKESFANMFRGFHNFSEQHRFEYEPLLQILAEYDPEG